MGKSWPRGDVLLRTPRIGVRKTFDFGGVRRRHRASFVKPDVFVELLLQIGPGNNASRTRFQIRSIKGLRSAPSIDGNDSATSARFRTTVSSSGETGRSARRAPGAPHPPFAVVHPSSPINGTKRTSAISSLRHSFSETRVTRTS